MECQHREKKVVEKMKQLKAELEEKNSKISYLQKELQRIKKALEKSRGNELKITEELGRVRSYSLSASGIIIYYEKPSSPV